MLAPLAPLLDVQVQDLRLQELRQQLTRIPKEQEAARQRLRSLEQAVEAAKGALQENEVAIKGVELDVGTRKETISRLKTQQFETRKNEEYQTLGQEIIRYEGEVDALETRELELMEKADELRAALGAAESAHATTNQGVENEIGALTTRAEEFQAELEGLETARADAMAGVDAELATLYERLLKSRGAPVVVPVNAEQTCTGCHVKVTPATMVKVQAGNEVVSCENCGRILYAE